MSFNYAIIINKCIHLKFELLNHCRLSFFIMCAKDAVQASVHINRLSYTFVLTESREGSSFPDDIPRAS